MTTDVDTATDATVIVTVTDEAREMVKGVRAAEENSDTLGLRIAVVGKSGVEYAYDLAFEAISEAAEGDSIVETDGLTVIVPADSINKLRGATLALPSNSAQGGLVIRNPNRPDPLEGIDIQLEGDMPEKINMLLDQVVNPQLAAHGGFTTLSGVDGTKVYLSMGGGCQGCAISAITLRQGIEAQLRAAIPEITEIIDVTDHDSGQNPYYTN
ncbi:MAG: NifU family protein [Acidimicrobiia bacterium]